MKKLLLPFTLTFFITAAQAQVRMPAPSPTQVIKQDLGLGSIELSYSRPGSKGRKVFGNLVPFDKLWRTGANTATTIRFTDAVEIGGKKIDSGTYALYSIPDVDAWDIILNKGISNWGTTGYKESDDVCRFKIQPAKVKPKLETFTMSFDNIKPESCELHLRWERADIVIPINTNVKEKIKAQIDAAMLTDKKPYWQAAQYYNEYDHNTGKALDNVARAIVDNPKAYWMWLYKAKIQQETGDKPGARESSRRSLELAKEDKNEDYIKMNEELLRKLK